MREYRIKGVGRNLKAQIEKIINDDAPEWETIQILTLTDSPLLLQTKVVPDPSHQARIQELLEANDRLTGRARVAEASLKAAGLL